jgi:hypothetical protein
MNVYTITGHILSHTQSTTSNLVVFSNWSLKGLMIEYILDEYVTIKL